MKSTKSNKTYSRLTEGLLVTQSTFQFSQHKKPKKNTEESKTEPGQTLTIKEMYTRAMMQGHFPSEETHARYLDSELNEIDKFQRQGLDLTDLDEARERVQGTLDKIDTYQSEKERVKNERKVMDEVERRLEEARARDERQPDNKPSNNEEK